MTLSESIEVWVMFFLNKPSTVQGVTFLFNYTIDSSKCLLILLSTGLRIAIIKIANVIFRIYLIDVTGENVVDIGTFLSH